MGRPTLRRFHMTGTHCGSAHPRLIQRCGVFQCTTLLAVVRHGPATRNNSVSKSSGSPHGSLRANSGTGDERLGHIAYDARSAWTAAYPR
jgi:hypothetical protein